MGRVITAPGVLKNVQTQIDHVTDMYDDIKDNNLKPLTVTLDPVTNANGSVSVVTEDERVTEDMKAISIEVGTPEVFKAPVSVTTGSGTVTLTCANATGTSTVAVTLVKTSPVEGGEDYPPAVTSTEFDILADRIGALSDLSTTDKTSIVNAVNEVVSTEAQDAASLQESLAIVANGNTHQAIASGQFVYVKNHSTLANGLYVAKAAIGVNGELSSSNLDEDTTGGLNALNGNINGLITYEDKQISVNSMLVDQKSGFYRARFGISEFSNYNKIIAIQVIAWSGSAGVAIIDGNNVNVLYNTNPDPIHWIQLRAIKLNV